MPKKTYFTNCVESTANKIEAMVDRSKEITFGTFRKNTEGFANFSKFLGYELDKRRGLTMRNDYHAHYYKSIYCGRPCIYVVHSCIEYIFI